jgi:DNA repair exonuclease SbcCD ATPase subunit
MLIFKKLRYKNILSTGDVYNEYNLCDTVLTLIIGKNGAGKTTMIDALHFALFGKAFRDINKAMLINTSTKKSAVVEVEFQSGEKECKVVRGIKPDIFEIYVNGVMLSKDASVAEYQKQLDKLIRMNAKAFRQVVVLGSRSYVPFMRLKAEERRAVIEDLLDLNVFTVMNKLNKIKMDTALDEIGDIEEKLKTARHRLEIEQNRINLVRDNVEESIDRLERKRTALDKQADDEREAMELLVGQVKAIELDPQALRNTQKRIDKFRDARSRGRTLIATCDETVQFYGSHDNCPTCKQILDPAFKQNSLMEQMDKKAEYEAGMTKVEETLKAAQKELQKIEEVNREITRLNRDIAVHNSTVSNLLRQSRECDNEIHGFRTKTVDFGDTEAEIAKWKSQYDLLTEEFNKKHTELEYLKLSATVLKDTGLKAKMVKQYIPVINSLINKYLITLGFAVSFELNETFSETIRSRNKNTFSYESFSEGEKMRLDLAIMFTWREIANMRNTVSTNLLVMDEVLDASLDAEGSESFLGEVVRDLTAGTNTIIVSHKSEHLKDRFDRVYSFKKIKGYSVMKVEK